MALAIYIDRFPFSIMWRGPKLISSPLLSLPSRYFGHLYCTLKFSPYITLRTKSTYLYIYIYVWPPVQKQYVHMYIYVYICVWMHACMMCTFGWDFPQGWGRKHSIGSSMSFWVFFVNLFLIRKMRHISIWINTFHFCRLTLPLQVLHVRFPHLEKL